MKSEKNENTVMQSDKKMPQTSKKDIKAEPSESVEVIDLTDEDTASAKDIKSNRTYGKWYFIY